MKTIIIILLATASAFGADNGVRVFTYASTNAEKAYTREIFTRDGETNLIHVTKIQAGEAHRVFLFYHSGQLVGQCIIERACPFLSTESSDYTFSLAFGPSNQISSVSIGDKIGLPLDEFSYTNGSFVPVAVPPPRSMLIRPVFRPEPIKNVKSN